MSNECGVGHGSSDGPGLQTAFLSEQVPSEWAQAGSVSGRGLPGEPGHSSGPCPRKDCQIRGCHSPGEVSGVGSQPAPLGTVPRAPCPLLAFLPQFLQAVATVVHPNQTKTKTP